MQGVLTTICGYTANCLILFYRSTAIMMNASQKYIYARRRKRYSPTQLYKLSIILAFFLLSSLISLLLPIYFANLPLQGF